MSDGELTEEQHHFIEQVGLQAEGASMPRMAGRIMGWLLICWPPEQTAADLARVLGASKGSLSTMLRMLVHRGVVERTGKPGQRSKYYRVSTVSVTEFMRARLQQISVFRRLAERGLELMQAEAPPRRQRLEELRDFHRFLELEMPGLLERYERQVRTRRPRQTERTDPAAADTYK